MFVLKGNTIKGATIVEVIVSIVIITAILMVSGLIFNNLVQVSFDKKEIRAKSLIESYIDQVPMKEGTTVSIDSLGVSVDIMALEAVNNQLIKVAATAKDEKGKLLYTLEKIVQKASNE